MSKQSPQVPEELLEQAYPQIHFLILALEGDRLSDHWLGENSHAVALFSRALLGQKQAVAQLEADHSDDLDDLFELIDNDDLLAWLQQHRPHVHQLFLAIQGDDDALHDLRKHRAAFARLVPTLRRIHDQYLERNRNGTTALEDGTMADMGCLIGEMHLRQGEFEKAIDAFTRAIETRPSADLFEGRARAYRELAARDESAAQLIRRRNG